uniref:Uncharacterized protein n=1 Tax=Lotus japonicus TaxID=34305 RepID=I3SI61_LOTJA|nr:unknown [Lotus japonicus]
MATRVTLSSPLAFKTSLLPKSPSLSPVSFSLGSPKTNAVVGVRVHVKIGGSDEDTKKGEKKKFITRDEEPQQ